MASSETIESQSRSRQGITLQGYDQVIALSQSHINSSLGHRFKTNAILKSFDESSPSSGARMAAMMHAPSIELREDLDKGSRAVLLLNFGKGDYSYWDFSNTVMTQDPSLPPQPKRVPLPTAGWVIGFKIDFSLQTVSDLPSDVSKEILPPGKYTVSQLMVDLSSANLATLDDKRTKIDGLDADPKRAADQRAQVTTFVCAYIDRLKTSAGNHAILGHAVTAKSASDAKIIAPEAPNFVPRKLRIQTMNFHPQNSTTAVEAEHGHNAFLFTEVSVTDNLPDNRLKWTGNWFIGAFGGTLAMSRQVFMDEYLMKKLSIMNKSVLRALNAVTFWLADPNQAAKTSYEWRVNDSEPGENDLPFVLKNNEIEFSWDTRWSNVETKSTWVSSETEGDTNEVKVLSKLKWLPGDCRISIDTTAKVSNMYVKDSTSLSFGGAGGSGSEQEKKGTADLTWKTDLTMRSVESSGNTPGKLVVDLQTKDFTCSTNITKARLVKFVIFPGGTPEIDEKLKEKAKTEITSRFADLDITSAIANALNGQQRFIFPGGSTFEFKDPVFNTEGNILINLSYIQRRAD